MAVRVGGTGLEGSRLLALDDPRAVEPELAGAKGANLARAVLAGLPVSPGFVLTPAAAAAVAAGNPDARHELLEAWRHLAPDADPVVVRSSSRHEDSEDTAMAGRFTSVLHVRDRSALFDAVSEVVHSGGPVNWRSPTMAVVVQRQIAAATSGVAFGLDPVTGRRDRRVAVAVAGLPDQLVSGEANGERWLLTAHGRPVERSQPRGRRRGRPVLRHRGRHAVVAMVEVAGRLLDRPADIEWAIDGKGRAWLLQARPITAVPEPATGPRFGPGPVAETFPDPMTPLEEDLWVEPLRLAIGEAVRILGGVSRRRRLESPVVVSVNGRLAVDLDLVEANDRPRGWRRLDPRGPARRLFSAWRLGRLRAALPEIARDIVDAVDRDLAAVDTLDQLDDEALLTILRRSRRTLLTLHGYELLSGSLDRPGGAMTTGGTLAAGVVAEGRAARLPDEQIVAQAPIALALVPPSIAAPSPLPPTAPGTPGPGVSGATPSHLGAREALRLRARWTQELSARAVRELATRIPGATAELLAELRLRELDRAVTLRGVPDDLAQRRALRRADVPPPLPAVFRRRPDGSVVPERDRRRAGRGQAAGGGRATGHVLHADGSRLPDDIPPGTVLIVRTLDPRLAGIVPSLAGLVSETGSVLAHLAIVAREAGIPTVVAMQGATERYPEGARILIDGNSGDVTALEDEEGSDR